MASAQNEQLVPASTGSQQSAGQQARPVSPRRGVKEFLESAEFMNALRASIPRHITPERFARIALTATQKNPELLNCTQVSLFQSLLELGAMGLEPDGYRAHLLPRRHKGADGRGHELRAEYQLDYKGIVELVRRNDGAMIRTIQAEVVYENDAFDVSFGTGSHLTHKPAKGKRGDRVCVYAYIGYLSGAEDFVVLDMDEVNRARAQSRRSGEGPWEMWYDEMAKKTAFRRLSKWVTLSPETRDAVRRDEENEYPAEPVAAPAEQMAANTQAKSDAIAQRIVAEAEAPRERRTRRAALPAAPSAVFTGPPEVQQATQAIAPEPPIHDESLQDAAPSDDYFG